MLTPEQMDDAGELVATAYRQIEADLLEYLIAKMIEGDISGQRAQTAILLLSQSMPLELKKAIDAHSEEIDKAARADVEKALRASDAFDLAAISEGLGMTLAADALTVQTASVLASVRDVIARDNVELNAAARSQYMKWTTWATTQVATGNMTADKAKHVAVRNLAKEGLSIEWVQYRDPETGERTVRNRIDVAVQRHIRSLIAQGAAQLTEQRIAECGCEFVEVSSHIGARPSHAEWHGRVYHVGGAVDVDGEHYEDFHEGTGYKGIAGPFTALGDQLLGVNCRHSFAPWFPGIPRAYDPNPEHPSGLDNDEVYKLTQKQRQRERDIRDTKRELAAAQQVYDADPTPENQIELAKLKSRLRDQQAGMRDFIREANAKGKPGTEVLKRQPQREWAGDMPKGKLTPPQPANRTLDQFMEMPSVERARVEAGLTKAELRQGIRDNLGVAKGERDDFHLRSAEQQREALENALKMSGGPTIQWPEHGTMMRRKAYKALRAYAKDRNVALRGFKNSDADPRAVKMAIDAIHTVTKEHPELLSFRGGTIVLSNAGMDSVTFAQVPLGKDGIPKWGIIEINNAAMRDLSVFEAEYLKAADEEGFYVRGTDVKSVLYHELGHHYQHVHGINARQAVESATGKSGFDANEYLNGNLSEYAGKGYNLDEAIPEAFSGHYGEVANETAEAIYEEVCNR